MKWQIKKKKEVFSSKKKLFIAQNFVCEEKEEEAKKFLVSP